MSHHDEDIRREPQSNPANRLGLNYRDAPPRKYQGPIIDIHTHIRAGRETRNAFFEAADLYRVNRFVTMSPLNEVETLRADHGERIEFIAVPRWREFEKTTDFRTQWLADLNAFWNHGARFMKFWMAPPMRGDHGLTLQHEFLEPVLQAALDKGYQFMTHIGDPTRWWQPGGKYADHQKYGSKNAQFDQLEYLLDRVAPRIVIGAHMGGSLEELDFLQNLLNRHDNYRIDSSATKWIVRETAEQPNAVRDFMIRNHDRILFGTDIVADDKYDFEHYASRFWTHQMLWESEYDGESPIEDPDAPNPPRLVGLDLPPNLLRQFYYNNARKLGFGA